VWVALSLLRNSPDHDRIRTHRRWSQRSPSEVDDVFAIDIDRIPPPARSMKTGIVTPGLDMQHVSPANSAT
jgi:hypothetical protein